ncbi:glycerol-3-phosphate dehydrogenase [Zobellella maritima]|uniref:glycerol-3-phosphate dehydrogenase n=1 Tax=Zobellella maritima TaxID=2059725 RepID=UPI000E309590|nr:glycerol-3-phosphate dehydrogenase [Zobellella maritima]
MSVNDFDLVVIGGGINGVGIAADAAGRGLKVALFEAQDLASATSSNSSKLIHGGLRYLEHYEFRLVKEALAEREVLLKMAPHIISPMRFRLPHRPHLRPAWMIRIGLFLYDHLAKRATLPGSHGLKFDGTGPLLDDITKGFEYSDAWVDDARLVTLNARLAASHGAHIHTRTPCIGAERQHGRWRVTVKDELSGEQRQVTAKALVNAAGPWVKQFFDNGLHSRSPRNIRLVKGSHIVVPRIHNEPQSYILQNEDNRIVFVIPYLDKYSLIGTTDVEYQGDPRDVAITPDEVDYLCKVVNRHFKGELTPEQVVWSYSGVRPLCDDESDSPQAITRDYTLELEDKAGALPLLSVFGGKLTTYRKLAESALGKLTPYFPRMGPAWTRNATLLGGEFSGSRAALQAKLMHDYPWLDAGWAGLIIARYGLNAWDWLGQAKAPEELGQYFHPRLWQAEVDYLMDHEWALYPEDVLWRRTKMGIELDAGQVAQLETYMAHRRNGRQQPTQALRA